MIVLDASIWVARLLPADVNHLSCKEWLAEQVGAGKMLVSPELLLPELAGAVSRSTGNPSLAKQLLEAVVRIPELRLMKMQTELTTIAARLAADEGLRGADALYVACAYQLGAPFFTLDMDQHERASHAVNSSLLVKQ